MPIPLDCVKLDKPGRNGLIEIVMFERIIIRIALKDLLIAVSVGHVLPLKGVGAVRDHVRRDPFAFARAALCDHTRDLWGHAQVDLQPFGVRTVLGTPRLALLAVDASVLLVATLLPCVVVRARRAYLPVFDFAVRHAQWPIYACFNVLFQQRYIIRMLFTSFTFNF